MNIVLIILLILAVLLFVPVTVEYSFSYDGNMKSSFILRFLFYKNDFSKKKNKKPVKREKKPKEKKKVSQIIEDVKYYKKLFVYFKKDIFLILKYAKDRMVKIKNLSFDIKFAGKDPMQTGIYNGVVNGAVYNAVAVVENTVGIDKWSVNVEPDFNKPAFVDGKFHCILNTKFAHIIVILIKLSILFFKYKINKKRI